MSMNDLIVMLLDIVVVSNVSVVIAFAAVLVVITYVFKD